MLERPYITLSFVKANSYPSNGFNTRATCLSKRLLMTLNNASNRSWLCSDKTFSGSDAIFLRNKRVGRVLWNGMPISLKAISMRFAIRGMFTLSVRVLPFSSPF